MIQPRKNIPSSFNRNSTSTFKFSGDPTVTSKKEGNTIVSQRITKIPQNMGGGKLENEEQKAWYLEQINKRIDAGMSEEEAINSYRNDFNIGDEEVRTIVEEKTDTLGGKEIVQEEVPVKMDFWHYVNDMGEKEFFNSLANNMYGLADWKKNRDDKYKGYVQASNYHRQSLHSRFIPNRSGYNLSQGMIEMYKNDPDGLKQILINNYSELLGISSDQIETINTEKITPNQNGSWAVISDETTKQ